MRLTFQISLALLIGLGTLYPGVMSFVAPADVFETFFAVKLSTLDQPLRLAVESQVRLLAGMWIAAGLFVLLSVPKFESRTMVIRLVLSGLILSAVGELLAVYEISGSVTAELVPSLTTIVICLLIEGGRIFLTGKKR